MQLSSSFNQIKNELFINKNLDLDVTDHRVLKIFLCSNICGSINKIIKGVVRFIFKNFVSYIVNSKYKNETNIQKFLKN